MPVCGRRLVHLGVAGYCPDFNGSELDPKRGGGIVMTAATINDLIGWSLFVMILSSVLPDSPDRSLWATLALA